MKTRTLRSALFAGAAIALLAACSDSSISSPGEGNIGSPPPPPPPPPAAATVNLVPAAGCPTGTRQSTTTSGGNSVAVCELTGQVQSNVDVPAGATVVVTGPVFVGTDGGAAAAGGGATPAATATLTIAPGATIVGNAGSDFIVVSRGSKLIADGTVSAPIVMTSLADVVASRAGTPRNGTESNSAEWGGLVINGRAPINDCKDATATGGTAACEKDGEASTGVFGGASPADNSGVLRYLQVRYAGFRINNENELNGIAFQGVGSGTTVDYVQVHNGSDDGMEFFGGAVNAKHIVLTGEEDDSFDWTDGWVGKVQFVVARQRVANASGIGDNGFEMDNRGGSNDKTPRSNPIISNFTMIGQPTSGRGMLYRAGTHGRLINGIISGFPTCLDIDDAATYAQITGHEWDSTYLSCTTTFDADTDAGGDEATKYALSSNTKTGESTLTGVFPGANELSVPFTSPGDSFFDTVSYIGAFGPSETTTSNWASGWTFGLFPKVDPTCPTGTTQTTETFDGKKTCLITGNINTDMTLVSGLNYELKGPVFVGSDRGGDAANPLASGTAVTLTVEGGVTVFGSAGADYLVVSRGSRLRSNGSAALPVTFTSRSDLEKKVGPNDRSQWGGVVLNGRAQINDCKDATAAGGSAKCEKDGEASTGVFGGNSDTDDSGNIFYTRVLYAGFRVNGENELNGIAFQGVGSGTEVDYVQVHNNGDDGMEFFGGAVNVKHLVLTGNEDDSLDWTDGWRGHAQFVIIQHGNLADNGFEMDNRSGSNDKTPRSNPVISNVTAVGSAGTGGRGMLYRAGTDGRLINSVFADFPTCLDIDDTATFTNVTGGEWDSTSLSCAKLFDSDTDAGGDEAAKFALSANTRTGDSTLSGFTFISGTRGIVPGANEKAMTVTNPTTIDPFFTSVDYVGAVKDANDTWYAGWTFVQQ